MSVMNRNVVIEKLKALASFVENDNDIKKAGLGFDPAFLLHAANLLEKATFTDEEPLHFRQVISHAELMAVRGQDGYERFMAAVISRGKHAVARQLEDHMDYKIWENSKDMATIVEISYRGRKK